MKKFKLKEVKALEHKPITFYPVLLRGPINWLTLFFANYTKISPNMITFFSLIFFILAAVSFYYHFFIVGAIFITLRTIFDHVDGRLARLQKRVSKFGAHFDMVSSYVGTALCLIVFFIMDEKSLLYMIIPFLISMFFLFPLQAVTVSLLAKKIRKRKYLDPFDFEDSRILILVVIPIIYQIISPIDFTFKHALMLTFIVITARQLIWMFYYRKDFKRALTGVNDVPEDELVSKESGFFK